MIRSLIKFFLLSSYIVISCVQEPETLAKRNERSPFLALFTGELQILVFSSERSPKNSMSTISFSSFRLVHSFVCNNRDSIEQTINVTHSEKSISSRNDFSFYILFFILLGQNQLSMFCLCKLLSTTFIMFFYIYFLYLFILYIFLVIAIFTIYKFFCLTYFSTYVYDKYFKLFFCFYQYVITLLVKYNNRICNVIYNRK